MKKISIVSLLLNVATLAIVATTSVVVHISDGSNFLYPVDSVDSLTIENRHKVSIAECEGGYLIVANRSTMKYVSDGEYVLDGTSLNVVAKPYDGYKKVSINVSTPFKLVSDTLISAVFELLPKYNVSVAPVEGGTVKLTCGGNVVTSETPIIQGKYVVCEIVADDSHFFNGVNVYKGLAVRDSFKVTKDTVVVPKFVEVVAEAASDTFKVCNYNIRYYNGGTKEDDKGDKAWPNRKDKVFEMIHKHSMDMCGIEEITVHEAPDFISSMTDYEYIGYGRDNGKEYKAGGTGEETGLIYKISKFVKLDQGRFFLSSTPNKVSKLSTSEFNRMVTWVKLKERATEKIIYFFATHFDHPTTQKGINTRSKQADIALEIVPTISGTYPMFFVGDFNCRPDEPAYTKLSAKWNDSFVTLGDEAQGGYVCNEEQLARVGLAADCACKGNTYTGLYSATDTLPKRIDYVLYNESYAEPYSYNADNDDLGYTTHPSDHVPVITEMKLK